MQPMSSFPTHQLAPNNTRLPVLAVRACCGNPIGARTEVAALIKENFGKKEDAIYKSIKDRYIYGLAVISRMEKWDDVDKSTMTDQEVAIIDAYITASKERKITQAEKENKDVKLPVYWGYKIESFHKLAEPFQYTGSASQTISALTDPDIVKIIRDENIGTGLLNNARRIACGAVDKLVITQLICAQKSMEIRPQRLAIINPNVDVECVYNICARIVYIYIYNFVVFFCLTFLETNSMCPIIGFITGFTRLRCVASKQHTRARVIYCKPCFITMYPILKHTPNFSTANKAFWTSIWRNIMLPPRRLNALSVQHIKPLYIT